MSNQVYAVIWDMDGVLINTYDFHYQAWSSVLENYQVPFTQADFRKIFGLKNERAIKTLLGDKVAPERIQEIEQKKEAAFREAIRNQAELLPGVAAWLDSLRDRQVLQAIATSAPPQNVEAIMEQTHIRHYFETIVTSGHLPGKPDPAVFLEAAERLGVAPERCLVIEDSIAGVQAAKSAGMKCIAVTTTNPPEKLSAADWVVENLSQLSAGRLPSFFD
jgi:beta-phosphoglucomutase